jgi:hypothetical protein
LYVGGALTQTFDGAVKLNNIARFGGGVWSPLPNNGLNASVNALAVSGSGDLYAGGIFTATRDGTVTDLNRIAKLSSAPVAFQLYLPLILR